MLLIVLQLLSCSQVFGGNLFFCAGLVCVHLFYNALDLLCGVASVEFGYNLFTITAILASYLPRTDRCLVPASCVHKQVFCQAALVKQSLPPLYHAVPRFEL